MAEVDPFIQPIPVQFQGDRELRAYYEYLHRFLHDIWVRTGGGDDAIENIQEEESSAEGQVSRVQSLLDKLSKRVVDLEKASDYALLNARIAATNKRIDELIDLLIEKLDELKPNRDIEYRAVDAIEETVKQLELANAKLEEAFETQINREDV